MIRGYEAIIVLLALCGCGDSRGPNTETPLDVTEPQTSPLVTTAEQHVVVKFTSDAVDKIREIQKQDRKPFLRVSVISGGPTGFMYDLTFDDRINVERDYVDDADGIRIVVDKRSALFLEGCTIDWETTADGRQGFRFNNPNAEK